jgi:hypothetical protein
LQTGGQSLIERNAEQPVVHRCDGVSHRRDDRAGHCTHQRSHDHQAGLAGAHQCTQRLRDFESFEECALACGGRARHAASRLAAPGY